VQPAGERGRIFTRESDPQRIGRAAGLARDQHAPDRLLALGEKLRQRAPPLGEPHRFGAQRAPFGFEGGERAVGFRDCTLRGAQRVTRFAPRFFLFLQLLGQAFDAAAKRLKVRFFWRGKRTEREKSEREERESLQAFAFPWLATAAVRLAISSASPR
jgi:hypothetical protein